ncbi:MAG: TIR domain-containing protein [Thermoanaerobaculia bacterium]
MTDPVFSTREPHGLESLRVYGKGFAGRQAELAALDQAWNEGTRIFVLHAEGGAGKTRVVKKWLIQMSDDGYRGAGGVFVYSFYSQGSDEKRNASSELFFEQALTYFGYTSPLITDPTEQGKKLARLIREQRGLLVLDGFEPLQHPPSFDQGRLKDPAIRSLLLALAGGRLGESSGSTSGLCVVTSRQPVQELQDKTGRAVVQQPLERLDADAGVQLLRELEVRGPERELRQAVEDSRGHAYSLMLLGTYLRDATDDHEIRRRHEIPLLDEDSEHRYHARHLFGAYMKHLGETSPEVAMLRLLGFFDRPAEERLVAVLREATGPGLDVLTAPLQNLSSTGWHRALRRLKVLRLIDIPDSASTAIDSHPLLREYFAEQLRTQFPEAWQAGHKRLFEHLCNVTEFWPDTLTCLQPLYQAIAHGCLAGLHQQACDKVYVHRVLRGTRQGGFYSLRILGAFGADLGAVAYFFTTPWTTLTPTLPPSDQAWLLGQAAFYLQALGRLTEAAEPMRTALKMAVEQLDWDNASAYASNLSELELTHGNVPSAAIAGEQAVKYADLSKDSFRQIVNRVTLADALRQSGREKESRRLFEDAESRQALEEPESPQLYAIQGFRYCDILLANAERSAWRRFSLMILQESALTTTCDSVLERANQSLALIKKSQLSPLSVALDHLTLARATLYKALTDVPTPHATHHYIDAAVAGLRTASQMDDLPRGLLIRAWIRFLSGDEPGCREDLDEAWEIAERGPMPLFQTDILLYRARLFRDRTALAEARRLIKKHGYHRRDEELADAEEASKGWPETPTSHAQIVESHQPATEPKPTEEPMRDQVFISYSHRDKKLMNELLTHLKPYVRSGITVWSDQQIASGSKWFDEIKAALAKTSVAVLLVSPDFLASDFIHEHELGPFLKEAKARGVRILWVPIYASSYEETDLKHLQAVSPPNEPIGAKSKADRDAAWVRVCKEIKKAVNP